METDLWRNVEEKQVCGVARWSSNVEEMNRLMSGPENVEETEGQVDGRNVEEGIQVEVWDGINVEGRQVEECGDVWRRPAEGRVGRSVQTNEKSGAQASLYKW